MFSKSIFSTKRQGTALAGVFSLALGSVLLLCGAGSTPTGTVMEADTNANGHNLTNAATVSAANFAGSGAGLTNVAATTAMSSTYAANSGFATNAAGTGGTDFGALATVTPGTGVATALGKQANASGGVVVTKSSDGSLVLSGNLEAFAGPAGPYTLACIGDSLTYGANATPATSFPGVLGTLSFFSNATYVINNGMPSYSSGGIYGASANSGVTTTASWTGPTSTITVASASGISTGMAVGGVGITPNLTVQSISGTTITLSTTIPTSGSSVAVSFATPPDPAYTSWTSNTALNKVTFSTYYGTTHIASPAVTGTPGYLTIMAGTNDAWEYPSICQSGTISGNTVSGLTGITSSQVGWNAFIGTTLLGTVTAQTSTSVTLSSAGGYSGTQTIALCPQIVTAPITNLVNAALADNWHVLLCTILPSHPDASSAGSGVNAVQFGGYNALMNAWEKSTYGGTAFGGATVANVTLVDTASIPELNGAYNSKYEASDGVHLLPPGYYLVASFINNVMANTFPASLTTPVYFGGGRGSVQDYQLSGNVLLTGDSRIPFLGAANTFTANTGYIDQNSSWAGIQLNSSGGSGGLQTIIASNSSSGIGNGGQLTFWKSSGNYFALDTTNASLNLPSNYKLGFSSGTDAKNADDTYFTRLSAGVMGLNSQLGYTTTANCVTGSGTPTFGSHCPATTTTAPYKWLKMQTDDGSTVYVPAWK